MNLKFLFILWFINYFSCILFLFYLKLKSILFIFLSYSLKAFFTKRIFYEKSIFTIKFSTINYPNNIIFIQTNNSHLFYHFESLYYLTKHYLFPIHFRHCSQRDWKLRIISIRTPISCAQQIGFIIFYFIIFVAEIFTINRNSSRSVIVDCIPT